MTMNQLLERSLQQVPDTAHDLSSETSGHLGNFLPPFSTHLTNASDPVSELASAVRCENEVSRELLANVQEVREVHRDGDTLRISSEDPEHTIAVRIDDLSDPQKSYIEEVLTKAPTHGDVLAGAARIGKLDTVELRHVSLEGENLIGADLRTATIEDVSFVRCHLEGVRFSASQLEHLTFDSTSIHGVEVVGARDLEGLTTFRGLNLRGADLSRIECLAEELSSLSHAKSDDPEFAARVAILKRAMDGTAFDMETQFHRDEETNLRILSFLTSGMVSRPGEAEPMTREPATAHDVLQLISESRALVTASKSDTPDIIIAGAHGETIGTISAGANDSELRFTAADSNQTTVVENAHLALVQITSWVRDHEAPSVVQAPEPVTEDPHVHVITNEEPAVAPEAEVATSEQRPSAEGASRETAGPTIDGAAPGSTIEPERSDAELQRERQRAHRAYRDHLQKVETRINPLRAHRPDQLETPRKGVVREYEALAGEFSALAHHIEETNHEVGHDKRLRDLTRTAGQFWNTFSSVDFESTGRGEKLNEAHNSLAEALRTVHARMGVELPRALVAPHTPMSRHTSQGSDPRVSEALRARPEYIDDLDSNLPLREAVHETTKRMWEEYRKPGAADRIADELSLTRERIFELEELTTEWIEKVTAEKSSGGKDVAPFEEMKKEQAALSEALEVWHEYRGELERLGKLPGGSKA
jgi:hypothetical protein